MTGNLASYSQTDYEDCLRYVLFREENPDLTTEECAQEVFGVSRVAVWKKLKRWQANGAYERVSREVLIPKMINIDHAIQRVVNQWPQVIERQLQDALEHPDPNARLRSANFLADRVVLPRLNKLNTASAAELEYLGSEQDFEPTDIPLITDG